jgi:hypothetical protein
MYIILLISILSFLLILNNINKSKSRSKFYNLFICMILFTISIYICFVFYKINGTFKAYKLFMLTTGVPFPIIMINVFTFLALLYQYINTNKENKKFNYYQLQKNSAKWTNNLLHELEDNISKDLRKYYYSIIIKANQGFYTKIDWNTKFKDIEYHNIQENLEKTTYVKKFIRGLSNSITVFDLDHKYIVGNKNDLKRSFQDNDNENLLGWFTYYRLWLSDSYVRNVWENIKYEYKSPYFLAWIYYFIINPTKNKDFWKCHRNDWIKKEKEFLANEL